MATLTKAAILTLTGAVVAVPLGVGGVNASEQADIEELRDQLYQLQQRLQLLEANQVAQELEIEQVRRAARNPVPGLNGTYDYGSPDLIPVQQAPAQQAPADEPVREAGPARSAEDIVSQEHVLFAGKRFTIEPGISYTRFDRGQLQLSGFLALDAIFLGQISVDEVESDVITADITGRWNVTDRIQLDANIPFVYRTSEFSSGGAGGAATQVIAERVTEDPNIGDVSVGGSFRVISETPSLPDVVLNLRGKAPTGQEPFGIETVEVEGSQGNLEVPTELPTGNGVWSVTGGVSVLKTFDPLLFFGNLSYTFNFEESFDDISAAPGNQPGDIDLGDSIQVGVGAAIALNERTSLSLSYSHAFVQATQEKAEGGTFSEVIGSDANVGVLNVGFTFALTDDLSIVTNLGAGMTEDASDVTFGIRMPYTF